MGSNVVSVAAIEAMLDEYADDELLAMCRAMRGWVSSDVYDDLTTHDIEYYAEEYFANDPMGLAQAIIYGDVRDINDELQLDGYGNLVTADYEFLHRRARDLVQQLAYDVVCRLGWQIIDHLLTDRDADLLDWLRSKL